MSRVYPALTFSNGRPQGSISLDTVDACMTQLHAMPYHLFRHWQTPTEVNFGQGADCKGKAIALYAQLRDRGARSVRFVIGKRHLYDSNTHAWLQWETNMGTYMLDPTFNDTPVRTVELSPMTYIPFYAYDAQHKYRAGTSPSNFPQTLVATGYSDRVNAASRLAMAGGVTPSVLTRVGPFQVYAAPIANPAASIGYAPPRPASGTPVRSADLTTFGSPKVYSPPTHDTALAARYGHMTAYNPQVQVRTVSTTYDARPVLPATSSAPEVYRSPVVYQPGDGYRSSAAILAANQVRPISAAARRTGSSVYRRSAHRHYVGHVVRRHRARTSAMQVAKGMTGLKG